MQLVKQSTSRALPILMVDATDGYTEETGLTLTVTVRKAGSSTWSASAGTTTERGNGSYEYAPTTGEVDTLGVFEYRAASAGARTFRGAAQVVVELPGVVASIASGAITASAIADGAIDAATFAAGAIDAAALASDAATEIATAVAAPSAATITSAVVAGMAAAPVGSVTGAVGSVTAGVTLAANAVTAAAVASDAVTELQAGLATASALSTVGGNVTTAIAGIAAVEADTQDLQARYPAALVGGRIDAYVGAMGANVVTSTALDATAATEIATAVGAPSAATISTQVAADLATAHGAGSWEGAGSGGATASEIADAVCDEALAGHATAGTVGAALTSLLSGVAALPSAATNAAAAASAVWAAVAEGGHTFGDYFRIAVAALVGRHTGTTGANVFYSPVSTSTPRVTATVASDGTRGNPTIDGD